MMGEGHVDEINEEGRGEKGNPFVFWCSGGEQIRMMRKSVGSHKMGSQNVNHGEIEIH